MTRNIIIKYSHITINGNVNFHIPPTAHSASASSIFSIDIKSAPRLSIRGPSTDPLISLTASPSVSFFAAMLDS